MSGNFYSSDAGFSNAPALKYYDGYTYSIHYATHERGKLGDATKEILNIFGNVNGGWYSDHSALPYNIGSWLSRGGYYYDLTKAGLFGFTSISGNVAIDRTTRAILVK